MVLPPHPPAIVASIKQQRESVHRAFQASEAKTRGTKKVEKKAVPAATATTTPWACYVDSPDMDYGYWFALLGSNPIGNFSGNKQVAVIGGGPSGCAAAYELARAGLTVQVFEQSSQVGGRCASVPLSPDTGNIVELGAMRFPGSEFILSYYMNKFGLAPGGIDNLPAFPDPGVNNTWVCWRDTAQQWIDNGSTPNPPVGFTTVYNGWHALAKYGITQGGKYVDFIDPSLLYSYMQSGKVYATQTAAAWQNFVTAFQGKTFYSVLQDLYTGKLISPISGTPCDIPGGVAWSFDDFDKFGTVGIGSGGFGALYPINFVEIWRLIVNGLENQQRFFAPGIRAVSVALQTAAQQTGRATFTFNTPIASVTGNRSVGFTLTSPSGAQFTNFAAVIVATTTRSMEITTNLLQPNTTLLSSTVRSAIRRTHVVSSVKVAARIKAFWNVGSGSTLPRVMQCDTTPCQSYTLDYNQGMGGMATGVCFITYTWDDDAVKEQGIAPIAGQPYAVNPTALYQFLLTSLSKLNINVADPYNPGQTTNWANLLTPFGPDPVRIIEWQSEPYYNGAFKLSEPGQDTYTQNMYWDFKKAGTSNDTGVFVAGDCASWTSGWVEGGLQTGLNAACGALISVGGSVAEPPNQYTSSPWSQRSFYNYFAPAPYPPTTAKPVPVETGKKKTQRPTEAEHDDEEPVTKKHTTEKAKTTTAKTTKAK
jgi:tryptophan 2-monooxygenase